MLEGMKPPVRNTPCAVRTMLGKLSDADGKILVEALADVELWPAKTLYRALHERDLLLSDTAINSHRKGLCSCLKG